MSDLRIYLLGAPYIEYQGQRVELARRKALALVAYLAVTNRRCNRDTLAALLWPDQDDVRARAGLRRVLAAINETPLQKYMEADRDTIQLIKNDSLWIDIDEFNQAASQQEREQAVELYRDAFMAGFSLSDSVEFDDWQAAQTQLFLQKLLILLEKLAAHYGEMHEYEQAIFVMRRWLTIDPLHETAQAQLMRFYAQTGQRTAAMNQYETFASLLDRELGAVPQPETIELYEAIKNNQVVAPLTGEQRDPVYGNMPPMPALVIGREVTLQDLKARLMRSTPPQLILQGWPGIGKTTLSALTAHDEEIRELFPDGVLWTSLGQQPNLLAELAQWGRALGISDISSAHTLEEASTRLTATLRERRMLLIVDDAWQVEQAMAFNVGGRRCGTLYTTRQNDIARMLANRPEAIYKIPILEEAQAIELLTTLAPEVVTAHPSEARALVRDLEGLPLALQVAGRLLHAEMAMGWGVSDLLEALRQGAQLLEAQAPADRLELATQTTPTIAALLQRSIDRLPVSLQERFAMLAVFAPKPATFTLEAMRAVWLVDDARPDAKVLVDRGLLEPAGNGIFQMHALLVMQAKSMFAV